MALTKIDDCQLYAAFTNKVQECADFKLWLEANNVSFDFLLFNDTSHHSILFKNLSTWWDGVTFEEFPFFIYTEIHDDLKPSQYPRKFYKTLDEIKNSDFLNVYKLGR